MFSPVVFSKLRRLLKKELLNIVVKVSIKTHVNTI